MSRPNSDLTVVAALAIVAAVGVLVLPNSTPRALCASGLLLGGPGYALSAAVFARRSSDAPFRLMVAVLLAIATLALGAVALNAVGVPLDDSAWTAVGLAVTLCACGVAALRRAPGMTPILPRAPRLTGADFALLVLAGAAIAIGIGISRAALPSKQAIGFTQLWMLPLGADGGPRFEIGVRSAEKRTQGYRLDVVVGSTRRTVRERLILRPGATFEYVLRLPDPAVLSGEFGRAGSVTALLYRLDRPETSYRRVTAPLDPS